MTPQDFIAKWSRSPKNEHQDAQPHFLDLCRLLNVEDPAQADPDHEWFTFEKGASRASGGRGGADVWRRGHFGWEYKSHGEDLDRAHTQLLNSSGALESPPLLIVSDTDVIRIHTNWTNTVQRWGSDYPGACPRRAGFTPPFRHPRPSHPGSRSCAAIGFRPSRRTFPVGRGSPRHSSTEPARSERPSTARPRRQSTNPKG
jgi:hypothetical protein